MNMLVKLLLHDNEDIPQTKSFIIFMFVISVTENSVIIFIFYVKFNWEVIELLFVNFLFN